MSRIPPGPASLNRALVGRCPRWLGKHWLAHALCAWGFHDWWRSSVGSNEVPHRDTVQCGRCGAARLW